MNKPIEQALENLLPRYSDVLPPQLIELASSLVVQSRSKCSLKADEEVARIYACANLACERVKSHLDLPPIEPRPPIPPRAYEKLYKHVESRLGPSTQTPKRMRSAPSTPVKDQRLTPSKSGNRCIRNQQLQDRHTLSRKDNEAFTFKWVGPLIRLLCKNMNTRRATAHVIAGVESILCLPRPKQLKGPSIDMSILKLPALLASVWLLVVAKLQGQENFWHENQERRNMVQAFFEQVRENQVLREKIGCAEENWIGWGNITEDDLKAWKEEIIAKEWQEMDWWRNIDAGTGVEVIVEEDEDELQDQDNHEISDNMGQKNLKLPKVIDKYDYLCEERRQEYSEWKSRILVRIEEMLAAK